MSKDATENEIRQQEADEQQAAGNKPRKGKKNKLVILGALVVIVAVVGVGFWIWHEQPEFCSSMCHTPMDTYLDTYNQEEGAPATDKWGNEVATAKSMLVVSHKAEGMNCLSCHVPSIGQQVHEVQLTLTGDYYYPLEEATTETLMVNSGHNRGTGDDFCLNEACHNFSRDELTEKTASMEFNPHRWQHEEVDCGECHKSHRASVFYCTQCHTEALKSMPEGWLTYQDGLQLEETTTYTH